MNFGIFESIDNRFPINFLIQQDFYIFEEIEEKSIPSGGGEGWVSVYYLDNIKQKRGMRGVEKNMKNE